MNKFTEMWIRLCMDREENLVLPEAINVYNVKKCFRTSPELRFAFVVDKLSDT